MPSLSWELAFPIGVILLGLAVAWGLLRNRTRNKANDALTEEATREEYSHPQTYGQREEALRSRLRD